MTSFALSISDACDADTLAARADRISDLAMRCPHLDSVCVRDDAMDRDRLSAAAVVASATGLRIILESDIVSNLVIAGFLPEDTLICSPNGDQEELIALAKDIERRVILTSADGEELLRLSSLTDGAVLNPAVTSMKQCLESTVWLGRRSSNEIMVRAWSGEYALAVSTVSVLRGGSLAVLDDLDGDACSLLDSLMGNLGKGLRCRTSPSTRGRTPSAGRDATSRR